MNRVLIFIVRVTKVQILNSILTFSKQSKNKWPSSSSSSGAWANLSNLFVKLVIWKVWSFKSAAVSFKLLPCLETTTDKFSKLVSTVSNFVIFWFCIAAFSAWISSLVKTFVMNSLSISLRSLSSFFNSAISSTSAVNTSVNRNIFIV